MYARVHDHHAKLEPPMMSHLHVAVVGVPVVRASDFVLGTYVLCATLLFHLSGDGSRVIFAGVFLSGIIVSLRGVHVSKILLLFDFITILFDGEERNIRGLPIMIWEAKIGLTLISGKSISALHFKLLQPRLSHLVLI
jgi:hypothetical protein